MQPFTLQAVAPCADDRCLWCQRRRRHLGERWIRDERGWLHCGPICYAHVVEGIAAMERMTKRWYDPPDPMMQPDPRFNDALTAGVRALAGQNVGTSG